MGSSRFATTALFMAILASTTRCTAPSADTRDATTASNKAVVRRWIEEGFNHARPTIVDELFAERVAVNGQVVDREGLKQSMARHLGGFPDLHVQIDDLVAEGNKVGIWYTVEGTHQGDFEGIRPTDHRVKWVGTDLFTIEQGTIVEARFLSDLHGLLTQLGATVSPRQAVARPRP
jgi:predicted ester cyclase